MSPIQFLLCVAIVAVGGAAGNLIRGKSDGPVFPAKDSQISKLGDEVSSPMELLDLPGEKQCRAIGDSVSVVLLFLCSVL